MPDDLPPQTSASSSAKEDRVSLPPIYTNFDDRRPSPTATLPPQDAMNAAYSSSSSSSSYAATAAAAAPVPDTWISRGGGGRPDDAAGYGSIRTSSNAGAAYRHDAYGPPPAAQAVPRQWASAHPERRPSYGGSASAYPYSPTSYSTSAPLSATSDDAWSPGGNAHFSQSPYASAGGVQSLGVLPMQQHPGYAHGGMHPPPGMGLPLPLMNRPDAPQRRRGKLPKQTTEYLKDWLHKHADHPYPSEDEKKRLCAATGLSMSQVSNWMINARRRILAPNKNNATPATTTTPYQQPQQQQPVASQRPDSAGSNGSARQVAAAAAPTSVRPRGSSDSFTQYQSQPYSPASNSPRVVASGVPGYATYQQSAGYVATSGLPSQGYDIIGAPSSAGGSSNAGGGSPHGSAGSGDGQ